MAKDYTYGISPAPTSWDQTASIMRKLRVKKPRIPKAPDVQDTLNKIARMIDVTPKVK